MTRRRRSPKRASTCLIRPTNFLHDQGSAYPWSALPLEQSRAPSELPTTSEPSSQPTPLTPTLKLQSAHEALGRKVSLSRHPLIPIKCMLFLSAPHSTPASTLAKSIADGVLVARPPPYLNLGYRVSSTLVCGPSRADSSRSRSFERSSFPSATSLPRLYSLTTFQLS